MKLCFIAGLIALMICFESSTASDLIVGTSYNAHLKWQNKMDYMGIPLKKRVKELFYADPDQQLIRGVIARESDQTQASVIITAGGVGFPFVNLRFKSQRSSGIYYSVEIYS